jgi:hypothetical protein
LENGEIMKKRLLTVLIVSTGIFFLYISIVCACPGGHVKGVPDDITDLDTWTMKIQILGNTESSMNIDLIDYAKIKNDPERNPKGIRQSFLISPKENKVRTWVTLYNDSKVYDSSTWYSESRRLRRDSKKDFENKKYEDTGLTLKEISDAVVKLTDRDQVTLGDIELFVRERKRGVDCRNFGPIFTLTTPLY